MNFPVAVSIMCSAGACGAPLISMWIVFGAILMGCGFAVAAFGIVYYLEHRR